MKSITDFSVEGKKVLVRCDFNVPLSESGEILNDAKIRESLPTLQYLLDHNAKVIVITHLGDGSESLDGVKKRLFELLGRQVEVLENIRSHKGEMENSPEFAKTLADMGDIYINEAFDVCHRNHASVVALPALLPHGAGFALQKEVQVLSQIMQQPERPMVAIIGGAKVSTKAPLVDPFCAFADLVIVNGLIKQELITQEIPLQYPEKVLGPKDNLESLDINEQDILRITTPILKAKTIFWNGPFGKFEDEQYKNGTLQIAKAIIESKAFSVVGGGETIEFLDKEGMLDQFSHVSTGGGAMLDFLAGQILPGLEALK